MTLKIGTPVLSWPLAYPTLRNLNLVRKVVDAGNGWVCLDNGMWVEEKDLLVVQEPRDIFKGKEK